MPADPSTNASPPPPQGGGAAQRVGPVFIRQYYKTLLESPSNLNRFYETDARVTRGLEPSVPSAPAAFGTAAAAPTPTNGDAADDTPGERIRRAFFAWAGQDDEEVVQLSLERGAIDAQESIGGGILLVVTGHMTLPGAGARRGSTSFVHTFFLNNSSPPGAKPMYRVKNDILRFVEPPVGGEAEDVAAVAEEAAAPVPEEALAAPPGMEAAVVEEPSAVVEQQPLEEAAPEPVEEVPVEPVEYEPSADEEKVEEADEAEEPVQYHIVDVEPAAEEEKTDGAETSSADSSPAASPSSDDKKKKKKKRSGKSRSRSRSTSPTKEEDAKEDTPEKPKAPSSWANLVASGGGGSKGSDGKKGRRSSPKASRGGGDKPPKPEPKPPQSQAAKDAAATAAAATAAAPTSSAPTPQQSSQRRAPNATLFIRNIPDKTTEAEVRALFEPMGKIQGITVNPGRGFCFIDFDTASAVTTIVAESTSTLVKDPRTGRKIENKFMLHGRVLDVERKVKEGGGSKGQGGRGDGGGGRRFNRSSSPKAGGGRYRGSRGGGGGGGMRRSPPRGGGGGNR